MSLSLIERVLVYAAAGTDVTLPAEDAKRLARMAYDVDTAGRRWAASADRYDTLASQLKRQLYLAYGLAAANLLHLILRLVF